MITSDDKQLVVYNDDYKPVNVYSGRTKIAGYKEVQVGGKSIEVEDTYNDLLDVKVKGHHEQDSRKAYWWNQLMNSTDVSGTNKGIEYVYKSDGTIIANGTAINSSWSDGIGVDDINRILWIKDHKYYVNPNFKNNTETTNNLHFQIYWTRTEEGNNQAYSVVNPTVINFKYTTELLGYFRIRIAKDVTVNNLQARPIVIDLTAMFGAGKEPTAEQFRKMFPCDYYPYCEGEWRAFDKDNYLDTAFNTPFPEMPEEVRVLSNPKVDVSSKGVVWNQVIKNGNFVTNTGWKAYNTTNSQISIINNTLIHTIKVAGTGSYQHGVTSNSDVSVTKPPKGTKILFTYEVNPSKTIRMGCDVCNTVQTNSVLCNANEWTKCEFLISASGTAKSIHIIPRQATNIGDEFIYKNVNAFNLTAMFGEGNEPQTVEEFKAMFPKDYYPYDPGTLRTIKGLKEIIPTSTEIPFELYGNGEVNDECEPCVLVDGEWKCRVTRRWGNPDTTKLDWKLETPVIELYPPIPIRTLPINTIINSDAELDCNIKVIDKQ